MEGETDSARPERVTRPNYGRGYGSSAQVHPLYRTTNQIYGGSAPTPHHLPTRFALSSRFSEAQSHGGMFVDSSLNTSLDKSRVATATARPQAHAHLLYRHGNAE